MKSFKRQIYKFGLIEDEKNPPTVEDNFAEYTSGIFPFDSSHFTNNFQDKDGDNHKLVRVRTLPPVGTIRYNSTPIEIGFVFNLDNVSNLTFELPNNYMISAGGYCKFDKPISTIISEQGTEGFDLTYLGAGRLEFEKKVQSTLPNDTDIYAFFDATSMKIVDAQAAQSALVEWYDSFKVNNELFTGNLFILPIVKENWLDFPNIILRGSSTAVSNNGDRPNDDFMALSQLPPNFDRTSNSVNSNWIPPTNVVTLAFIDEVDQGSTIPSGSAAYHRNRNGYGFDQQPSSQYLTDYKNFRDNYGNFTFFKGILYPIPDIEAGSYNNSGNAMVLQGFAAIEGGATYTLEQIQNLGATFVNERRFHWHLDPTHPYYSGTNLTVANPYSAAANTSVPNSNYTLQGLNTYGWVGVYDKDQPASAVFSSDTFNSDLNKYLKGQITETIEYRVIEGQCFDGGSICFDFQTSDDSSFNLYSNIATFCFIGVDNPSNIQEYNPPTVSSVVKSYNGDLYQFELNDFTTNFNDIDGDSFKDIRIFSDFTSSKGTPIQGITNIGVGVTYPFTLSLNNINDLEYQIPSTYYVVNDRLLKFNSSLSIDIINLENQGYTLLNNENNILTFNKLNLTDPLNPVVDIQTIEGKDIGDRSLTLPFKTSDNSIYNLYSNTQTLTLEMSNSNSSPTVEGGFANLIDSTFIFSIGNFTNNYLDVDGDIAKTVKIQSYNTLIGTLLFKEHPIMPPFSFSIDESTQLKFVLGNQYSVEDGVVYEFENSITDIVTLHQNEGYSLETSEGGILVFVDKEGIRPQIKYEGIVLENSELCLIFAVGDSGFIETFSNDATFCLIPTGDINIPTEENQPPTIGDVTIYVETQVTTDITMEMIKNHSSPPYNDKENDLIDAIRIDGIKSTNLGRFYFNGTLLRIGQIITREQIESNLLTHVGSKINDYKVDTFSFSVRDEVNGKWVE